MYSIMEFASIVVLLCIMETENLLGLHVNATKAMEFLFVSLDFTLVGFIAFLAIQTRPLYFCDHKKKKIHPLLYSSRPYIATLYRETAL